MKNNYRKEYLTPQELGKLDLQAAIADEILEKQVLTSFIGTRNYFDSVSESICENCFNNEHHKNIYKAIKTIVEGGNDPDMNSVWADVQKIDSTLNYADFIEIVTQNITISDLPYSVRVLDYFRKRRAMQFYGLLLISNAQNMTSEVDEEILKTSASLVDVLDVTAHDIVDGGAVQDELLQKIYKRMQNPTIDMGFMTGYKFIDTRFGIHRGDFIVIAGPTGAGKTSFTLNVVDGAMHNGAKVALYSLEMSKVQVQSKFLSRNSKIKQGRLLYSQLSQDEYMNVCSVHSNTYRMFKEQLFYNDKFTSNIERIISDIRSKKKKCGIDIAVIDYMQIASSGVNSKGKGNKEAELADMARMLRNLANDLQIAIIVLSQLSRDRENPVPTRDRLRGSGQIAEAATDIWLIYRPGQDEYSTEKYPAPYESEDIHNSAMVIVDKCRFGRPDKYLLGFNGELTEFYELNQDNTNLPF